MTQPPAGAILVVDDVEDNRNILALRLRRLGYGVTLAENGRQALDLIARQAFDLVLLDIMMPELNGYQVLERIKSEPTSQHLPVVMVSATDEIESVVRCIELGAEDYLFKPFNPVLLKARVAASLERKRLHDQEREYLTMLEHAQRTSEQLLLNILPKPIADRLRTDPGTIAESFGAVTVLFADIVDFTALASQAEPSAVVRLLNELFSTFDELAAARGLEKIKTIGDAYMAVGGLPTPRPDHASAVAELALAMRDWIAGFHDQALGRGFELRIGIHTGPAIAGVIGTKKFSYDLWGDTVNVASRMESQGLPGQIQVSAATYELLRESYRFEERGPITIKGKGQLPTFILHGRRD
ncbi:MAG TPA: adenylate/guanylate cyclase domain-containing protein [Herpetosiphonaceae bacterium]